MIPFHDIPIVVVVIVLVVVVVVVVGFWQLSIMMKSNWS